MCPSSGETTVFMQHLVLVCIPDSHPYRITNNKIAGPIKHRQILEELTI